MPPSQKLLPPESLSTRERLPVIADQLSRVGLDLYKRNSDRRCSTVSVHRAFHQRARLLTRRIALVPGEERSEE